MLCTVGGDSVCFLCIGFNFIDNSCDNFDLSRDINYRYRHVSLNWNVPNRKTILPCLHYIIIMDNAVTQAHRIGPDAGFIQRVVPLKWRTTERVGILGPSVQFQSFLVFLDEMTVTRYRILLLEEPNLHQQIPWQHHFHQHNNEFYKFQHQFQFEPRAL